MPLPAAADVASASSSVKTNAPLTGLRLAVKDLFHIAGLPTSAGNPDWLSSHPVPAATSSVVTTLLENGCDFVGKTITDELAYSLNGQNKHYGMPLNPHNADRLPGGSSSGSAVAVAMNLADVGLGTDTGGSIRVPASYLGLYGLRPTHGFIPMDNMVALAPGFDTVGIMTRDLATLGASMACLLPDQPTSVQRKIHIIENALDLCEHSEPIRQWLQVQQQSNPDLIGEPVIVDFQHWQTSDTFRVLQGAEIWAQHGEWLLSTRPDIADDIQLRINACATLTEAEIQDAQVRRDKFCEWFHELVEQRILLLPTTPGISPLTSTPSSALATYRHQLLSLTALAGLSGCPQLHLPVLTLQNAPCGVSLIGPRGSDKQLLQIAEQLGTVTNE